jgi:PIN domain nuclease of toxin-antitoxin system
MRLLLDTHALLWRYFGDPKLSPAAAAAIADPAGTVFVSAATCWEVAVLIGKRRLRLTETFDEFVRCAVVEAGFGVIPVRPRHAAELLTLPFHHKDPFDRMLVAQAQAEGLTLVTCDADIALYPVPRLW